MSSLYVVGTPIGNLEDITLRAIRILTEVDLIVCEDKRITSRLLNKYNIKTSMTSYNNYNKLSKVPYILSELEQKDIALVSDAGLPCINDPGQELVASAIDLGHKIVPIPGVSSVTTAVSISGMIFDQWVFVGFFPKQKSKRMELIDSIINDKKVTVLLESPHRLQSCLKFLLDNLGDRKITVCREMTKLYEDIFRGKISEAIDNFNNPKGEFIILIEAFISDDIRKKTSESDVLKILKDIDVSKLKTKEIVDIVFNETGVSKKNIYKMWLDLSKGKK
ncbi:MAG: 16S rRNA (cytidine(1402)-2'-O)-methyltransferase [Dehalococcoidia bacterium]|mgnify:CR=1 FL=1|nr:16S rRNA (cytidine(1402)-2'-O)-methyltransferase [Chloroflexota bacterium]|tara:strand:- start:29510 stop:30343 length:834 start_codon:yes stop_codon:yes gene_type:complete